MPKSTYPEGEDATTHPGGITDEERAAAAALPPVRDHEGLTPQGHRAVAVEPALSPRTPGARGFIETPFTLDPPPVTEPAKDDDKAKK